MTRRILLGALFLAIAAAPGCSGCGKPPPVPLDLPEQPPGTMLFPPADDGWLERAPFDATSGRSSRNLISVYSPKLDDKGHFDVSGATVSISFDKDAIGDTAAKTAPLVTITPAHPGRTVWVSKQSVEFRADKPFDPETEYTATLPELTGPTGNKLTGGFKGTFKATPETKIAGKIVHWIPKPGEPRVVYVRPIDERDVGPNTKMLVIWDQPIEDAKASKSVSLKIEKGGAVALTMSRPAAGDTFEGEKVDTKSIAWFAMTNPPPPGTKLELEARDHDPKATPTTRKLTIRPLPKLEKITCGASSYWSGKDDCEVKGNTAKGSVASTVGFLYTNRIFNDDIEKHVTVTPTPPKLRINGWGEAVNVDAAWVPSSTYQIRVTNLVDRFGYRVADASATFTTLPRTASAILREGVMVMDEAGAKDFYVTTRNVKKGELLVWPVAQGNDAAIEALKNARANKAPSGTPKVIPFDGTAAAHVYERATLDLFGKLDPGHMYLAQVRVKETAHGATEATSSSTQPSVPLFVMAGKDTPGAHVHVVGQKALVHVYRFASGEAIAGASVALGPTRSTTDDKGVAVLDLPAKTSPSETHDAVTVRAGNEEAVLPLDRNGTGASEIYPELTTNEWQSDRETLGFLVTDRGIYRPGSKLFLKGFVRKADDKRIGALSHAKVMLKIKDPLDSEIVSEAMTTSDAGTITKDVELPKPGHTGRHRIRLELDDQHHTLLAEEVVRVAEFETPRFKVDVEAPADMPEGRWKSRVVGRYFFGAPMDGARVEWTIKKKRKDVEGGKLEAAGFSFGHERNPFDNASDTPEERPRTGTAKLARDGSLDLDVELGPLPNGPTDVTFEADVADESYRHIAGRKTVLKHPFARYGGVKLGNRFGGLGALKVELAAVDTKGKPVGNVPMEARLERLEWKKSSEKAESGATVEKWGTTATSEGTCSVTVDAAGAPKGCELAVKRPGDYRVVARIDGRDDASVGFYAWAGANDWHGEMPAVPSSGKKTPISSDKKKYVPGDVAKVLVQSPFPEATAILTVERGGMLSHEVRRIKGASTLFDVPISIAHAPYAHAVVTLLPIGGPDASYRVGVVRMPVALDSAKLTVKVTSDKKTYDVKETAEVTIEVKRGDQPIRNADVTLAVVDEAVLRLTDFHVKDPTAALHPPRALEFSASDSRAFLFRRKEKAHVAGGGGADDNDSVDTRKDFVETAAWLPALTTDDRGRVTTKVKLPDNLTEFRMMATVVSDDGSAGVAEEGLIVTRPFLLEPVMPAFALKGDKLELAAMVHNNTGAAANAKVKIDGETREVRVPANGRQRVGVPFTADKWRETTFTLEVDGRTKDKVTKAIRVGLPGTEEHPQLAGVFRDVQEITLAIPADAIFDDDAKLVIKTGAALYPELGQRLLYLQGYPHGCVEQTTSGLLPLLAAQNLIPWTGVVGIEETERKKRIAAGVKRLGTMKLWSGGLSMWPGGSEVNLYGTIYAARALLLAKKIGIEEEGLLTSVLHFLGERSRHEQEPVLKVAIAETLAMAEKLEPDVADSLMDVKDRLDVFGTASLALALSAIPKQGDRVKGLLDALEASYDEAGMPKGTHGQRDYHYWGSTDRDRAQTLMALVKLRPASKLTSKLAHRLIRNVDSYTTQGTAWSLVGLAAYVGTDRPNGSVDVKIKAEGLIFDRMHSLGGDNKEVGIALKELRGKKVLLRLEGDPKSPCSFAMEARYVRPDGTSTRNARRAPFGPSVYRVYTDPKGKPIDLAQVKAGDVVRVALRVEIPKLDTWRASYLAVTDRLAAGFQPIQPDLATVAQPQGMEKDHPFYDGMNGWSGQASYVDIRDDRVNVYFDHVYGASAAYATYLVRAVTPGDFLLPPAVGELMYEPGSFGYSDAGRVTVK